MRNLEKILKAFANKRRLAMLKFLKENGEASVGDIAAKIKLSLKATSKHLNILFNAEIVDKEQRSLQSFYKLSISQTAAPRKILSLL